jgi:hypothetical protein
MMNAMSKADTAPMSKDPTKIKVNWPIESMTSYIIVFSTTPVCITV